MLIALYGSRDGYLIEFALTEEESGCLRDAERKKGFML